MYRKMDINRFVSFAEVLNKAFRLKYLKKVSSLKMGNATPSIKAVAQFSDLKNMELPLMCSGRLITSGEYFDGSVGEEVILSPEELKRSVMGWRVPIMKSHAAAASMIDGSDVGIDHIAGQVGVPVWNDAEEAIDWEGIIADEDIARKIALGLIKFGSVTFSRDIERREDGRLYYINIEPLDFSLVFNPKDKNASIKAGGLF